MGPQSEILLLIDPGRRALELAIIRRALKEGWIAGPVYAGLRATLASRLGGLLGEEGLTDRERRAVARCLLALDEPERRPYQALLAGIDVSPGRRPKRGRRSPRRAGE